MKPGQDWWVFPGFELKLIAKGLDLPVNIAVTHNKSNVLLYVTELYGQVRAITKDYKVYTYAQELLNYKPVPEIPGKGESGVTGICIEPQSGDLLVSMLYEDKKEIKGKLVRMKSKDGLKVDSMDTIIDDIPSTTKAHQIQAPSIGFDGKLYLNVADGGSWEKSPQDDNDLRGKILRMNLDGSIPTDNPVKGNLVFSKGFRNPFGAAWRKSDKSLYVTINGPAVDDVLAKVEAGSNHGWYGDMRTNALFWWHFTQAPTALDFMQDGQFHSRFSDELFVALFGDSYQKGRQVKGKKIVKMRINKTATGISSYDEFVTYTGKGAASPCGLAFGDEGLYFSDLHGGNIYLVRPREDYDFDKEMEHVFP
ncbi:MAG: PQQ-dependent sugar dehydrogenase [Actinomycetota bacterium]